MDTIAAVSTAYGRGGIAVIRISGEEAIEVANKMFRPASGKRISDTEAGRCVYGDIIKDGIRIDDGMCTVFKAPHSYTSEDTAEISCHGGIIITEKVLEAAFEAGARQAGAGEFTRRAFINGKLSLSEAEAVGMLIDAKSEEQMYLASSHENGILKRKSDELYEKLKTVVTGVYANVDFPDEDLAELSDKEVLEEVKAIENEISKLKASYRVGKAVCEGIETVIVGKPNTGKSSLLNRILGRERAIVTEIAGTTRDTIEENALCGRVMLHLCDTAGIRESDDTVERIGVEKSIKMMDTAELILAIFDLSREIDTEDTAIIEKLAALDCAKIAVLNKSDLEAKFDAAALDKCGFLKKITVCAANEDDSVNGISTLKEAIEALYIEGDIDYNTSAVITNARQNAAVSRTLDYVRSAVNELSSGSTADTAGFDLEAALTELSELDGRRVTEEIVDAIFHRFCVGK